MNDWAAVARVVNERMAERGITQRELADASGVSVATVRQVQQGEVRRRSTVTLGALSRALGYPDDYLRRIALGGAGDTPNGAADPAVVAELRAEVEDLRQRVAAIESRLEPSQSP